MIQRNFAAKRARIMRSGRPMRTIRKALLHLEREAAQEKYCKPATYLRKRKLVPVITNYPLAYLQRQI